jgi:hypothetical protein
MNNIDKIIYSLPLYKKKNLSITFQKKRKIRFGEFSKEFY